jgi:hypothetical protein
MAVKKVTVNLPEDQIAFLQKIAETDSLTFTDALRRAINSEKFFVEQERSGSKVLVQEPGQKLKEVLRR